MEREALKHNEATAAPPSDSAAAEREGWKWAGGMLLQLEHKRESCPSKVGEMKMQMRKWC